MANNGLLPADGNSTPMQGIGQQGGVQPLSTNAAALTANTVYLFKWGPSANQQVNHLMIQNNATVSVNFELDNEVSAGSAVILPGQTLFLDIQTIVLHLLANGTPNVNGSTAGNIVVRGWL